MSSKIALFWQETKAEIRRVEWPSKQETIRYTIFVVLFSLIVAALLGAFDFVFLKVLENFISS
jgi:preprotein translocase subunit SecE